MPPALHFGFSFDSLRSRLLLLVMLAVLPPVCFTVYGAMQERQHAVEVAESDLIRLTGLAAASEAKIIDGARQFLVALSDVPDLMRDAPSCSVLLQSMLKKNTGYNNIGVLEMNGDVRCSAVPNGNAVNLSDRANFKKTLATGKFATGDYVFGRVVRKHAVNASYPIVDSNNNMIAMAFVSLDLTALDRFIEDIDFPRNAILITADSSGTVIGRYPHPERWIGTRMAKKLFDPMVKVRFGTAEITDLDGITRLHAFAPVGGPDISNFTVSIGIPIADIVASANYQRNTEFLALLITAGVALLSAWFVANITILNRVRALVHATRRIGAGDLSSRSQIRYGREEISELALAFDRMAYVLQRNAAEQEHIQMRLIAEKERAQVTLKSISDGIISLDSEGKIEFINPVAESLTGWSSQEAYGMQLTDIFKTTSCQAGRAISNDIGTTSSHPRSNRILIARDGNTHAIEHSISLIHDNKSAISGTVVIFRDISQQRDLAQQLAQLISQDPLTGLANRLEFERHLEYAFEHAGAQARHHTLLYIDIDHFKAVNERWSRKAGDALLSQVARLFKPLLSDGDALARVSGDKFAVLLKNCTPITASRVAEKICKTVREHCFIWDEQVLCLSVSIGLVNFNDKQPSMPALLKKADEVCKSARQSGGNCIHQCTDDFATSVMSGKTTFENVLP